MNIYDYFLTDGIVCNYNDFIKILDYSSSYKSILNTYKNNINRSIKNNKDFNNNDLKKINNIFDKFKIYNDVNLFCYELINFKHDIKYKIEHLNKLNNSNKINILNKLNNSNKINILNKLNSKIYLNPLYDLDLKKNIINKNIHFYTFGSSTSNDFKNQLDILYYGKYLNNNLPSLGVISNKFNDDTYKTVNMGTVKNYKSFSIFFTNFFKDYINNEKVFLINLPISNLNIEETMSEILTNQIKNINNINEIKDVIKGSIEKIKNRNIGNILKIDIKKSIINDKYIVPYIINKLNNIEYLKKKIDIKTYFKLENNYKNTFKQIYKYIEENIKKPKTPYFDKLLALYLYLQIELYYDLNKDYIKSLTNILIKLSTSSDINLNKLNFKEANIYIDKLEISLLKFKKILLNNFYNLFIPTKIDGEKYGILLNPDTEINEIDPNADLIGNKISNEYPLFNSNTLLPFIINFKKHDIYDKTTLLEIGTLCFNNKYFSSALNIFKNYLNKYNYIDKNNLIIINYIKKYFEKCIIIEQLNKIKDKKTYLKKENLDTEQKVNLENILFTFFKDNLEKSSICLLNASTYKKLSLNKEIELFKSKIYYNMYKITFKIIENVLVNIDLKNKLIRRCNILEENYIKLITKKIKNTTEK